jgi:hypothetical protein
MLPSSTSSISFPPRRSAKLPRPSIQHTACDFNRDLHLRLTAVVGRASQCYWDRSGAVSTNPNVSQSQRILASDHLAKSRSIQTKESYVS